MMLDDDEVGKGVGGVREVEKRERGERSRVFRWMYLFFFMGRERGNQTKGGREG